jgi:TetR/AcrR family fatty acid metabolism transcriptional regulator
VVEGTVFHYFSTKKLLMARIIEVFYEEITAELRNGLTGIQGTRNRLHYVIRFHLDVVTRNSRLCGEILRESRGLDGELARAVSHLNRSYTQCLSEIVKEGIDAGDIDAGVSIPLLRNTVYGSIEHTLWAVINDNIAVDIDGEAAALTALVYQGIARAAAPDKRDVSSLVRRLNELLQQQQSS